MEPSTEHPTTTEPAEAAGLQNLTRQALEDAERAGDPERLELLEELYASLERELARDFGETASSRR
ncbi:MAG: hypothetical protein ACRDK3_18215 [Actinomycetota bacterium]